MIRTAIILVGLWPGILVAQSLSLEELQAQIDADSAQIEGFRTLLSDPDPSRAIAAMRAMMASEDVLLENLALEAGLTSTNGAMRRTALEAYLATSPTLQINATLQDDEAADPDIFRNWMSNYASLSGERTAVISLPVGPPLKEQNCYSTSRNCTVWPTSDGLTFSVQGVIGVLRLAEDGSLVGTMGKASIGGAIDLRVDLLGAPLAQ